MFYFNFTQTFKKKVSITIVILVLLQINICLAQNTYNYSVDTIRRPIALLLLKIHSPKTIVRDIDKKSFIMAFEENKKEVPMSFFLSDTDIKVEYIMDEEIVLKNLYHIVKPQKSLFNIVPSTLDFSRKFYSLNKPYGDYHFYACYYVDALWIRYNVKAIPENASGSTVKDKKQTLQKTYYILHQINNFHALDFIQN